MTIFASNWLFALLAVLLMCVPTQAGVEVGLEQAVAPVVEAVAQLIQREGREKTIAIGDFTGPAQRASAAAPGIRQALIQEFTRQGITPSRRADLGLKGEYLFTEIDDADPAALPGAKISAIRLNVKLTDANGETLSSLNFENRNTNTTQKSPAPISNGQLKTDVTLLGDQVKIIGPTVDLSPEDSYYERAEKLKASIRTSQATLVGTEIKSSTGSPYSVEILVKRGNSFISLKPVSDDGLAVVDLKLKDIYAIRLINRSKYDAAVQLSIDGLNVFAFSQQKYSFYIVSAGKATTIKGWHKSGDKFDAFEIGTVAESAVRELLASEAQLGSLTAAFSAAWTLGTEPPDDEVAARQSRSQGETLATRRGPEFTEKLTPVERHIGVIRSAITVHYGREFESLFQR